MYANYVCMYTLCITNHHVEMMHCFIYLYAIVSSVTNINKSMSVHCYSTSILHATDGTKQVCI